ncbi:unnamed protein product [Schistosoma haematobium]|nr:unnamed protein product [Schistosoma haematobium]
MYDLGPMTTAFYNQVRNQGCIIVLHKTEKNIRSRSKKKLCRVCMTILKQYFVNSSKQRIGLHLRSKSYNSLVL